MGINGKGLRFKRGFGREVGDIHRLGMLESPPQPVRLAVVVPRLESQQDQETLRQILLAHLVNPKRRNCADVSAGMKLLNIRGDNDSLYTLWSSGRYEKLGLPPFDLVPSLHMYAPATGALEPEVKLHNAAGEADASGRILLGLAILPEDIEKKEKDKLFKNLCEYGIRRILPTSVDSLRAGFFAWKTLAVRLAQRAGGVPWDLRDLPGVHEQTYFLGIDLGHNHQMNTSILALTLHDYRGRPIKCKLRKVERNSECIALNDFKPLLKKVLPHKLFSDIRLIVHRDGRYLQGEVPDILTALSDVGIEDASLIAIKKDSLNVASNVDEGNYLILDQKLCLLVTNKQAEGLSVPKPIEVEVVAPGRLTLQESIEQVFWLSRVFMDSAQHANRLPAPTHWANGIARTGRRVPLDGWRYS